MAGLCFAAHGSPPVLLLLINVVHLFSAINGLVRFGTTKAVDAQLAARIE